MHGHHNPYVTFCTQPYKMHENENNEFNAHITYLDERAEKAIILMRFKLYGKPCNLTKLPRFSRSTKVIFVVVMLRICKALFIFQKNVGGLSQLNIATKIHIKRQSFYCLMQLLCFPESPFLSDF